MNIARLPLLQMLVLMAATSCMVALLGWWQRDRYLAIAQPATLQDVSPDGTLGATTRGSVTWNLTGYGDGNKTLVAHILVPGRRLDITLYMRKNLDDSLDASHLIQIVQDHSPNSTESQVEDISVPWVFGDGKDTPLNAVTTKNGNRDFRIALSPIPQDIVTNLGLLRRAKDMGLSLTYASGQRSLLIFRKGAPGQFLLRSGLLAWAH